MINYLQAKENMPGCVETGGIGCRYSIGGGSEIEEELERIQVFPLLTDYYIEYSPPEKFPMKIGWKITLKHEIDKRGKEVNR